MSQSLYDEQNGYYANAQRVGTKGDFYTSVSASKFFGGAIASYILSLLENGDLSLPLRIVEIGADKGYLLGDIALFLDALSHNVLQECTFITLEPFSSLAQIQMAHLASLSFSTPLHFATFRDCASCPLPNTPTSLFVITNELFDSFPCEVIKEDTMLYISQDSPSWRGMWGEIEDKTKELLQNLALCHTALNPAQYSGILPLWQPFIASLAHFAKAHTQSYIVNFDYGNFDENQNTLQSNPRFFSAHTMQTLASFLAQNGDFKTLYQKVDITYDVDFTLLDILLRQAGFTAIFGSSQAKVLIEQMRLLELLESFHTQKGFSAYFKEIHKVKTLLHTMGERFKGVCYKM